MPYIPKFQRRQYDDSIENIVNKLLEQTNDDVKGCLNYIISSIIKKYIDEKGMRYFRAQDLIGGVLTCSQLELYRRYLVPYEDKAIEKNGDI